MTESIWRTQDERVALRSHLTDAALKHGNTCLCGICRFAFPESYSQCDACDRHELVDSMTACFTMSDGGEVDHYICETCWEACK